MKGLKCSGLLFLLLIIFGLSLNVSSDVNALKYDITSIDFSSYDELEFRKVQLSDGVFPFYFTRNHNFSITFQDSVPDGFEFPHTWRFRGQYDPLSNSCELRDYSDGVYSSHYSGSNQYFYNISLSNSTFALSSLNPEDSPFDIWNYPLSSGNNTFLRDFYDSHHPLCIMDHPYASIDETPGSIYQYFPRWNWLSLFNIPLVNNRFEYEDSKPFVYQYDKLRLRGNYKDSDGVIHSRNGISLSDIFKTDIPSFVQMGMHFSLLDSATNRLDFPGAPETEVSNFIVGGTIKFEDDYALGSCTFAPTCIHAHVSDYNFDPRVTSSDVFGSNPVYDTLSDGTKLYHSFVPSIEHDIDCLVTDYHTSNGDPENKIIFACPYEPFRPHNIDFRNIVFNLSLGGTTGYHDKLFTTSGDVTLKDFYLVTNDNFVDSGWDATDTPDGGDTDSAPGTGPTTDDQSNWFSSLVDMFTFGFFNPFAPIFQMFSDNNSCASIPTISSMIHSEESQVCPWFDSSIRNIVTPVLGLSSMMLVFGFAVRWLGSSSGNLFEDSSNEEVSNQGGRWGHFKKGGF